MRKSHGECDDKDENENDRIDFEYTGEEEEEKKMWRNCQTEITWCFLYFGLVNIYVRIE